MVKIQRTLYFISKIKDVDIELFSDMRKKTRQVLEGRKSSSSKRIVLDKRGNNKVSKVISQGARTDKVKINKKETFFSTLFPHVILLSELVNVHSRIRNLFSVWKVPKLSLAGRSKQFLETRKILTEGSENLELMEGWKIYFHENHVQEKNTRNTATDRKF